MTRIPIFDHVGALQSIANVYFDSLAHRTGPLQFTVRVRVAWTITPNLSLPAAPYPPNPLGMMQQGLVLNPMTAFVSAQGVYDVRQRPALQPALVVR